ncbi:MAG: SDR family oxidoreductase, partial [Planctomycetes bacterium]|nr:SDR family oxidoreductase [Planctomycetota bacterium]
MAGRFDNRVAVVTGAAKGMGRATALRMAREGGRVLVTDIDKDALAEFDKTLKNEGLQGMTLFSNVAKRDDVEAMIDAAMDAYGRIDILVNNAGLLLPGTIEETTDEIIDNTIDIN